MAERFAFVFTSSYVHPRIERAASVHSSCCARTTRQQGIARVYCSQRTSSQCASLTRHRGFRPFPRERRVFFGTPPLFGLVRQVSRKTSKVTMAEDRDERPEPLEVEQKMVDFDESLRSSKLEPSVNETLSLSTAIQDETAREAILQTLAWVSAALLFAGGIFYGMGPDKAAEFVSGYLVEQSLSIDNLFVFMLVFRYFAVPLDSQKRCLSWGLMGAATMRLAIILAGSAALSALKPLFLGFAAILLFSAYKLLAEQGNDEEEDLSENKIVQFAKGLFSFSDHYEGNRFFNLAGQATPLLLVLLVIELSDVVFAVDSIPAVFGITVDPFIVYTSNIFAILSLRSVYLLLSSVLGNLRYLQPSLGIVLGFVGSKMIADYAGIHVSTLISLGVISSVLAGGVSLSLLNPLPTTPSIPSENDLGGL
mmetsp:Transcript_33260/g.53941  ORF Transcript_33260/g.53941 Transcript_33260/m.53941 type:complete len:423 (-) Transcript_33260:439-1707(-)